MKHCNRRFAARSVVTAVLLIVIAACGGEQTVASRSAAAFQEAQKKGTSVGGDGHGGHDASSGTTSGDPATMTGMDHSQMKPGQSMAGMDHSQMKPGQSMAGMDHSQMKPGQSMAGMDHSQMKPGQSMAGMDHSAMSGMGVTSAPAPAMSAPTTNSEMQQLRPAATLRPDPFDAPVPVSVSEARKAGGVGSDGAAAPAMDHSQHGGSAQSGGAHTSVAAPVPASSMDHSQHGQAAPSPAPKSRVKATPKSKPAAVTIYACPMHPEVTSGKAGSCPKCGMALVKK